MRTSFIFFSQHQVEVNIYNISVITIVCFNIRYFTNTHCCFWIYN